MSRSTWSRFNINLHPSSASFVHHNEEIVVADQQPFKVLCFSPISLIKNYDEFNYQLVSAIGDDKHCNIRVFGIDAIGILLDAISCLRSPFGEVWNTNTE